MRFRLTSCLVAAIVLGGCGGNAGEDDSATPTSSAATSVPDVATTSTTPATVAEVETPSPVTITAPVATDVSSVESAPTTAPCVIGTAPVVTGDAALACGAPSTSAAPMSVADCLLGVWLVPAEAMANIMGAPGLAGANVETTFSGQGVLTFDASGEYRWQPDYRIDVTTGDYVGFGLIFGSVVGAWAETDSVVSLEVESDDLQINMNAGESAFAANAFDGELEVLTCTSSVLDIVVRAPIGEYAMVATRL